LGCAALWLSTWQLIQTTIDRKIQQQMETNYNHFNKKSESLQQKQPKFLKASHRKNEQQFYPKIKFKFK